MCIFFRYRKTTESKVEHEREQGVGTWHEQEHGEEYLHEYERLMIKNERLKRAFNSLIPDVRFIVDDYDRRYGSGKSYAHSKRTHSKRHRAY